MIERLFDRFSNAIVVLLSDGLVVVVMLFLKMVAALMRYILELRDLRIVLPIRIESIGVFFP